MADRFGLSLPRVAGLCLLSLLAAGVLAGCGKSALHRQAEAMPIQRDISVHDLAGRLGLTVAVCNNSLARLGSDSDTVTVFAAPGGSVYVNGSQIAANAEIYPRGRTLMLPSGLEDEIRRALAPGQKYTPPPKPARPRPIAYTPIGLVVIDPGHGGKDSGAISATGHYEKTLVLAVAKALAGLLRESNVEVRMTRKSDVFIPLDDRAALANRLGPDLFVSIHADAAGNHRAKGFTVYVPRRQARASSSYRAGKCAARQLACVAPSRGVRQHNKRLRVLEKTRCPAMLVELGFLSNPAEARRLDSRDYRAKLAAALADAIVRYLKGR
jgi:N-acetylmuramoyl-L-alanine amidase